MNQGILVHSTMIIKWLFNLRLKNNKDATAPTPSPPPRKTKTIIITKKMYINNLKIGQ